MCLFKTRASKYFLWDPPFSASLGGGILISGKCLSFACSIYQRASNVGIFCKGNRNVFFFSMKSDFPHSTLFYALCLYFQRIMRLRRAYLQTLECMRMWNYSWEPNNSPWFIIIYLNISRDILYRRTSCSGFCIILSSRAPEICQKAVCIFLAWVDRTGFISLKEGECI